MRWRWPAKVLIKMCFKYTLYSCADVFFYWVFQNFTKSLNLQLCTDIPKYSLIDLLSSLHHIQKDRTIFHGDIGEIHFIDFHSVIDWDPWGWAIRFHRYRLLNGDVKATWQRQESREEFLLGIIKVMLELHTYPTSIRELLSLTQKGICRRSKWHHQGADLSRD